MLEELPRLQSLDELRTRWMQTPLDMDRAYNLMYAATGDEDRAATFAANVVLNQQRSQTQ